MKKNNYFLLGLANQLFLKSKFPRQSNISHLQDKRYKPLPLLGFMNQISNGHLRFLYKQSCNRRYQSACHPSARAMLKQKELFAVKLIQPREPNVTLSRGYF